MIADDRFCFWRGTAVTTVFALVVFILTTARFAFPGTSARYVAEVAGLASPSAVDLPIWRGIMRIASCIPVLALPWRLNLVNALFAAVAVGAVFRLVALLVQDLLPVELSRSFIRRASRIGGAAAAVGILFSASGWSMASHLTPVAFELAVAAICLNLVNDASRWEGLRGKHLLAAFVLGLCAAGSGGLTIAMPFILLAMLVQLYYTNEELRWGWTLKILCTAIYGIAMAMTVSAAVSSGGESFLARFFAGWEAQVAAQFHGGSFILMLCVGYLPLAVVLAIARGALSRRDMGLGWIVFMATLLTGAAFIGLPGSPWYRLGRSGHISMPPLLNLSIVCGIVAVFWFERRSRTFHDWTSGGLEPMSGEKSFDDDDDDDDGTNSWAGSLLGWLCMIAGVTCIACGAVRHFRSLHLDDGAFLDVVAEKMVAEGAQGRGWLDPRTIGPHILIASQARGRRQDEAADSPKIFDDDMSIDDFRWFEGVLGGRRDCHCAVDSIKRALRSKYSGKAVDSAVKLLKAGDDGRAADVFREIAKASPDSLSAFANWASMFNAGHVKEGLIASQEKESLKEMAGSLMAIHGETLPFDKITSAHGEIIDPDALAEYGFEFKFPHGVARSPGFDAWDDFGGEITMESLRDEMTSPRNSTLPSGSVAMPAIFSEKVDQAVNNAFRAHCALRELDLKSAREFYKRSNLMLANAPALDGMAKCALALGDYADAEEAIAELLAFDGGKGPQPRYCAAAWNMLSIAKLDQGRSDEAVAAARKAIDCDGGAAAGIYPRFALARALAASGDSDGLRDVAASLFREIDVLPGEMRSEVVSLYRATR